MPMRNMIIYPPAFILFLTIQCPGNICKAEQNKLQSYDFHQKVSCNVGVYSGQNAAWKHKIVPTGFTDRDKNIKLVVAVIENRFIAKGIITDIKRASKGIQKFSLQIKNIEPFKDYPNFGDNYVGKTVEIFSEIGIPSSFQIGMEVSVILRVSGDEWGQTLFLVEAIDSGTKN